MQIERTITEFDHLASDPQPITMQILEQWHDYCWHNAYCVGYCDMNTTTDCSQPGVLSCNNAIK